VAVRIPRTNFYAEFEFVYDTGASNAIMYQADIDMLERASGMTAACMGLQNCSGVGGTVTRGIPNVELEFTLLTPTKQRMTKWQKVKVAVLPGYYTWDNERLDGPWLSFLLYTATAPRYRDLLYVSTTKSDLTQRLPAQASLNPVVQPPYSVVPQANPQPPLGPPPRGPSGAVPLPAVERNMPQPVPGVQ
jgi:hypothetical protein